MPTVHYSKQCIDETLNCICIPGVSDLYLLYRCNKSKVKSIILTMNFKVVNNKMNKSVCIIKAALP